MTHLKITGIVLLFCFIALNLGASEKKYYVPSDIASTGGAGVAATSKTGMIFMNPAAPAASVGFWKLPLVKIGARLNADIFKVPALLKSEATNAVDLPWEELLRLKAAGGINGPLSTGYIGNGFTFYAYDSFYTSQALVPYIGLPYIKSSIYLDFVLMGGYSAKLPDEVLNYLQPIGINMITAGLMLKLVQRYKYENERLNVIGLEDTLKAVANGQEGVMDGTALGVDLGLLALREKTGVGDLRCGIVLRDLFLPFHWKQLLFTTNGIRTTNAATNSSFAPALDIGFSYVLPNEVLGDASLLLSKPVFYLDLVNLFDLSESIFLKFKIGADIRLIDILVIRAGFYQGYPSIGLGLDIPLLKFDLTYYSEELGKYPGSSPQQNFLAELSLMLL